MSKPMAGSEDKKRGVDPRLSHQQCLIIKKEKNTGKKTFSLKKDGEYGKRSVTLEDWSFQDDMIFSKGVRYLPDNIGDDVLITAMLDNDIIQENAAVIIDGGALTQGKFNSMSKQIKTTLAFGESAKRFNRLLKSQEFKNRLRQQVDGTAVASAGSHPSAKFVTKEDLEKVREESENALAEAKEENENTRASDASQFWHGMRGLQKVHMDLAVAVKDMSGAVAVGMKGLTGAVSGLTGVVSNVNVDVSALTDSVLALAGKVDENFKFFQSQNKAQQAQLNGLQEDVGDLREELAHLKALLVQQADKRGHLRDDKD